MLLDFGSAFLYSNTRSKRFSGTNTAGCCAFIYSLLLRSNFFGFRGGRLKESPINLWYLYIQPQQGFYSCRKLMGIELSCKKEYPNSN
jgi:hypothetical protein